MSKDKSMIWKWLNIFSIAPTFNSSSKDIAMCPFTFTLTLDILLQSLVTGTLVLFHPNAFEHYWMVTIPCNKVLLSILTPRVSVPLVPGSRWQWPNLRFSAPLQGAILNPGHGDLCPLSHHHHTAPTLGPLSILLPLKLCMNLISSFM